VDLLDKPAVDKLFLDKGPFDAIIHCAGLKAVGESVAQPSRYYRENLTCTLNLLDAEKDAFPSQKKRLMVFSSSATVYSATNDMPVDENGALAPSNPYGQTKHMIEQVLRDYAVAESTFNAVLLRYFNPIGGHP